MFETTTVQIEKSKTKQRYFTVQEYLEMEELSDINHEYDNGKLIPMAGGTPVHSKIKGLIITTLNNGIRTSKEQYDVFNSDIRIHLPELNRNVMPDGAVVVGKPVFTIENPVGLLANPTLIVEVFSKSSEGYDRGEKFKRYRTLPSLMEYMLVSQDKPLVETFVKKENRWFINEVAEGLDVSIKLVSLGFSILLSDIYWGVKFEEKKAKKATAKKSD